MSYVSSPRIATYMWKTKASITGRATFRHHTLICALFLLATSTHTSRGNIVPAHTQIPIDKAPQKSLPKKDLPSAITVSIAASANIAAEPHGAHSAFYLIRSGGFDRELSVTLQISGTAPSRSEHMTITTFVTFLPGETERFVAIQPILQDLFAPRQQLFLRVVPGAKYSTDATTATVKI